MKRTFILITVLFLSTYIFAQIKISKFEGVKDYNNGHRIAYFYIEGLNNNKELINYISSEFRTDENYSRFIIYPSTNTTLKNRVMMEANVPINTNQLSLKLNQLYQHYSKIKSKYPNDKQNFYIELYNVQDFPIYIDTGNEKQDEEIYEQRKKEWIKNNPKKFNKIKHLSLDIFSK